MDRSTPVTKVSPSERVTADPTPGMTREQAIARSGLWAGLVRTEPHMVSGWHHHADYDTAIYIVDGLLRMESGPDGGVVTDGGPGDFLFVPKGAVHREMNPGDRASEIIVIRAGEGPPTVNVDGPAT